MVDIAQMLTQIISHQGVIQEFDTSFQPESRIENHKSESLPFPTTMGKAVNSVIHNDIDKFENRLLFDDEYKYIEKIQFDPTQLLISERKDDTPIMFSNESVNKNDCNVVNFQNTQYNDGNKTLSHSDTRMFVEKFGKQIIKKDDSGDSRLNTLTCEKNTESIGSNIVVNLNVISSENITEISNKCPILNSQTALMKPNTVVEEEESSISIFNKQNMNENPDSNILSKQFFQRFDEHCENSSIDLDKIRSHSPSLSSSSIHLTTDLKSFERFENFAHPIVHKYANCNNDLRAEIALKYSTLPELEESVATCSCKSVSYQISYDSNLDPSLNSLSNQLSIQSQQENSCLQDCKVLRVDTELKKYHDAKLKGSHERVDFVERHTFNAQLSKCSKQKLENIILQHQTNHKCSSKISKKASEIQTRNSKYSKETKNNSTMDTTCKNRSFDSHFGCLPAQPSIDYSHIEDKGIEIYTTTSKKEFSCSYSNKKHEAFEELKERHSPHNSNSHAVNNPLITENQIQEFDIFDDMFDTEDFSATEVMKLTVNKKTHEKLNKNTLEKNDECALPDFSCSSNDIISNENLPKSTNCIDNHNLFEETNLLEPTSVGELMKIDSEKTNKSSKLLSKNLIMSGKQNTEILCNNQQVDNMFANHAKVLQKSKEVQSEAEIDTVNNENMTSCKTVDKNFDDYNLFKSDQHYLRFTTASNRKYKILYNANMEIIEPVNILEKDNLQYSLNFKNDSLEKKQDLSLFGYNTVVNKEIEMSEGLPKKVGQPSTFQVLPDTLDCEEILEIMDVRKPSHADFSIASHKSDQSAIKSSVESKNLFDHLDFEQNKPNNLEFSITVPQFGGFHTANNKKIEVSEKNLAKARNLFSNWEIDENYVRNFEKDIPNCMDLQITSNEILKISGETLHKTKTLFGKVENDQDRMQKSQNYVEQIEQPNKIPPFLDFQKVQLAEKALQETKVIFRKCAVDLNNAPKSENNVEYIEQPNDMPYFVGFQTASNKKVHVSEEALQRSKNMLKNFVVDLENVQEGDGNVRYNEQPNKTPAFVGFQTASNKLVEISGDSLQRSKNMFEMWESKNNYPPNRENYVDIEQSNGMPVFLGLQTTSNKKTEISESVQGTKTLFGNLANGQDDSAKDDKNVEDVEQPNKTQAFVSCQIANEKKIGISNKNFEKNENLCSRRENHQDNHRKHENYVGHIEKPNKISGFLGFQTANKKKIEISEKSLQRTKALFQNWEREQDGLFDTEKNAATNITTPSYVRFQTASNKDVEITEAALQNTKRLLENSNIEKFKIDSKKETQSEGQSETQRSTENKFTFVGFQTASNKKVNITEKALKRSRRLFQNSESNGDDLDLNNEKSQKIVKVDNFSKQKKVPDTTIKVKVSEETLTESQTIFKDLANKGNSDIRANLKKNGSNALEDSVKLDHSTINLESLLDRKACDSFYGTECTSESHKRILQKSTSPILTSSKAKRRKTLTKESTESSNMNTELKNFLDTQVSKNFDQTFKTEDFHNYTPIQRSTSPILLCSRAKRKKLFTTPYSKAAEVDITETNVKINNESKPKIYHFKSDYKNIKKYSLNDLIFKNNNEENLTINIDLDDIMNFEFDEIRNNLMEIKMKMENLKIIFLNSPDINSNIVPEGWIENHLKLISWKLISYELKYCNMENVFNAKNLLDQLKYRYDRELYNCERPALRKILEKDDISTRTMVLCVMKIICNGNISHQNSSIELELTDGWYTVNTVIDNLLKNMVSKGTIKVGTKIMTQGAELINCDQGICPWEDISSVRLKIHGNSTRRVRWYTRLGFHGNAAMLIPLSTVSVDGGKVSKIKVFVARVYPLLYMEKFEDGSRVTRSERLEHLYEAKWETERQLMLEKIYDEVEKEFMEENPNPMDSEVMIYDGRNKRKMEISSQIAKCAKKHKHSAEFQEGVFETQKDILMQYALDKEETKLKDFQNRVQEKIENSKLVFNRNVVAVLKVRIVDVRIQNGQTVISRGLLSVWNVNESVMDVLKEGRWVEASNVTPTGMRGTEVMISANRHSIFNKSRIKDENKFYQSIEELSRKCTAIDKILKYPQRKMEFNEIDTVGLVFAMDPTVVDFRKQSNHKLQKLYLADEMKNIICINFWGGLQKYGLERFIDTGQIVICMNLQKCVGSPDKFIPQFRATEYCCFTKIPKNNKSRIVYEELRKKFTSIDISKFCKECIKLKECYLPKNNVVNRSPYSFNNNRESILSKCKFTNFVSKNKTINDVDYKKITLDLTESDFECSFDDMENMSPSQIVRKKRLNEKLQKLRMYDEPPKLSTIVINNKSSNANTSYKSPLSNNVAVVNTIVNRVNVNNMVTPKNDNLSSCVDKSAVNPIKLDFSADGDTSVKNVNLDEFLEEFDASPPLSLSGDSHFY